MRQEVESHGAVAVPGWVDAQVCVVNTCTVTNKADAEARRFLRRIRRDNPSAHVVVAGCSAALRGAEYSAMEGVSAVVAGPDPRAVASAVSRAGGAHPRSGLVQLELRRDLDQIDEEPVGAELLRERAGATRGWLKIQDGCDRHCSFCATRIARGASRSRTTEVVVREAALLAHTHPELVLTGIHIGHYGRDLDSASSLSLLLATLLDRVPDVRFRLGSVEATEVDSLLLDLMVQSGGRVAPHLHMPLQSGADPVLRRMRRWHTREGYRRRAIEIAERLPVLGLGADIITGFPGETDADQAATLSLVEELPYTYLHVFPFSPRDGTFAAELNATGPVPQRVAGSRARELRKLAEAKGHAYRVRRSGAPAEVTLEARGTVALTGDYLRVRADRNGSEEEGSGRRLHSGVLRGSEGDLYIDLSRPNALN